MFFGSCHKHDQPNKEFLVRHCAPGFINMSVSNDDMNIGVSSADHKRWIQSGFIEDTSVMVVLVIKKTKQQKPGDSEIFSTLNKRLGGSSLFYARLLPTLACALDGRYLVDKLPSPLVVKINSASIKMNAWNLVCAKESRIIKATEAVCMQKGARSKQAEDQSSNSTKYH